MNQINILNLFEKKIIKLSDKFNGIMINKIKDNFTLPEQQFFVSSFYCYLNYDKNKDFLIDLNEVWKWLDFSQKIRAKELLVKNFVVDIDYKISSNNEKKRRAWWP